MHNLSYDFWNLYGSLLEAIFWILLLISLFTIFFYYLFYFIRLPAFNYDTVSFDKPISIIICAKNELINLKKNLPSILAQDYFNFEVVVVNDQSNDESIVYLEELALRNKNLTIVDIDDFVTHRPGKKFALTLGIKSAKYDYLIMTDADCIPNSKDWIKLIASNFNTHNIVLGYGSYEKKKGLLNKIIRYDTFNIAQQYLSFALAGQTYMGVGRNLAYKKSLFFKNKGFATHMHIASGDDDLFIQEIALNESSTISIVQNSHTTSEVMESWRDWVYQKRRHISASDLYKTKFKVLLLIFPLSQAIFYLSVILLFFLTTKFFYLLVILVLKWILSYFINYNTMRQLNVFDLYLIHPLYEIVNLFIQGNFVLLNLFSKPKKWLR